MAGQGSLQQPTESGTDSVTDLDAQIIDLHYRYMELLQELDDKK